jgi:hypothetical protein
MLLDATGRTDCYHLGQLLLQLSKQHDIFLLYTKSDNIIISIIDNIDY